MNYIGDFEAGSTVNVFWTTNDGSGGRVAGSSAFEVADVRVYKNVTATKRSSEAGYTIDDTVEAMVGVHSISIDTSDNTDSGFFAAGNDYTVVFYPDETVDSESVSRVLCQFSIENRHIDADVTKWLGTAVNEDTPGYPKVTVKSGTGAGEITTLGGAVYSNLVALSGSPAAAGNLFLMYSGAGYTVHDTAPASRAQLDKIANTGSAQNKPPRDAPDGFVIAFGENEVNDEDATSPLDGTYHQIEAQNDTGTEKIDVYYEFQLPGFGSPTEVVFSGRMTKVGGAKHLTVHAWNWNTSAWRQIGLLESSADDVVKDYKLFTSEVGTGTDVGLVRIRFLTGSVALAATSALYTDQIFVSYATLPQSTNYDGGRISVNTVSGSTDTVPGVDGISGKPVTWAAAVTLAGLLGIKRFEVNAGSAIALTGNSDGYDLIGKAYALDLSDESIEGAVIEGATVTGLGTATVTRPHFTNCEFGACTIPPCEIARSGFGHDDGTFTAGSAGEYVFHDCYSDVPGATEPVLDFGGLGATTKISNRGWLGGAAWTITSFCTLSHEPLAGGGTSIVTGGGNAEIRGITKFLTLVLSGSETVTFLGITGAITISGTAVAATVTLDGVSTGLLVDTSENVVVTDNTMSIEKMWTRVMAGELAALPSQTVPTMEQMMMFKYGYIRNKIIQNPTHRILYAADDVTPLATWTESDVAGAFTQEAAT